MTTLASRAHPLLLVASSHFREALELRYPDGDDLLGVPKRLAEEREKSR